MMWLLWALAGLDDNGALIASAAAADLEAIRRVARGEGDALAFALRSPLPHRLFARVPGASAIRAKRRKWSRTSSRRPGVRRRATTRRAGVVVAWLLVMTRSRAIDRVRVRAAGCRRSPATANRRWASWPIRRPVRSGPTLSHGAAVARRARARARCRSAAAGDRAGVLSRASRTWRSPSGSSSRSARSRHASDSD